MSQHWQADSFEELFRGYSPRVASYVRRQVESADVDDVVAEVFTVAWRRLDAIPADPLPWLLTVARNHARHSRRSRARREALWMSAVREQWREPAREPGEELLRREEALAALEQCSQKEREALILTAWDGLSAADAAAVVGCSAHAFTVRLGRARRRFDAAVAGNPGGTTPETAGPARTSPQPRARFLNNPETNSIEGECR